MARPYAYNCVLIGQGAAPDPKTIPAGAPGTVLTTPSGGGEPVFASTATIVRAVPAVWVRVSNSTTQAIVDATDTACTCDTEAFDTDAMHSTVTNTARLTCTVAGVYIIGGGLLWATPTALVSDRVIGIRLNGTSRIGVAYARVGNGGFGIAQNITTAYALAVNDYVEVTAFTSGDGTQNVTVAAFWAVRQGA